MRDERIWVGLDLGLRLSSISFVDGEGVELLHQECPTTLPRLKEALAAFPLERIGLVAVEASNEMHIVRKLRDAGYPVAIFESRKASKFLAVRNNKTDAGDARGLADLARIGRNVVPQVYLKSPECQQLRGLLVMRKRFVMMRVAAEAALRSNLALHGRRLRSVHAPGILRRAVEAELAELRTEEGIDLSGDLQPMVDVCESLRAYLKKLERDLERTAKSHTVCRLLMEVPGVGPICALSFYSAIEDPDRFRSASDVGAYLGLSPRRYQSGRTSRTLGITKAGSKLTRTHLVTAATVFGNTAPDCALKRWFMALRERAGSKRARVALARKLAVILLTMWKDGAHFHLYPAEAMAAAQARGAVTAGD